MELLSHFLHIRSGTVSELTPISMVQRPFGKSRRNHDVTDEDVGGSLSLWHHSDSVQAFSRHVSVMHHTGLEAAPDWSPVALSEVHWSLPLPLCECWEVAGQPDKLVQLPSAQQDSGLSVAAEWNNHTVTPQEQKGLYYFLLHCPAAVPAPYA
ncbi:unnamed protein product [Pleuronectes platessa]|uniref:Uncharacterized protein n=1 Tax=Pleuronectes platessa TaxID=8262 RepID=A0A9N7TTR7_PLEPL|nr:unnamed protein product [Pleuronectes platessa]